MPVSCVYIIFFFNSQKWSFFSFKCTTHNKNTVRVLSTIRVTKTSIFLLFSANLLGFCYLFWKSMYNYLLLKTIWPAKILVRCFMLLNHLIYCFSLFHHLSVFLLVCSLYVWFLFSCCFYFVLFLSYVLLTAICPTGYCQNGGVCMVDGTGRGSLCM